MPRLPFVRHRTANPIRSKYRSCRHAAEKVRWHALRRLARTDRDRTPAAVADPVGLSAVTVRAVLHRWNDHGPEGVADRRKGSGAAPELSARRRAALPAAVRKRPPDGGLWTGPKVAAYVRDRWRVVVRPDTGWRWLVALGFSLQGPRPSPPKGADRPTQRRWEKTSAGG